MEDNSWSTTTYTVSGLTNQKAYRFRIRAVHIDDNVEHPSRRSTEIRTKPNVKTFLAKEVRG